MATLSSDITPKTGNKRRKGGRKRGDVPKLKQELIAMVAQGRSIKDALIVIDRSRNAYEEWRRNDKQFAMMVDAARLGDAARPEREFLPFPEFSERYLEAQVFDHTQNIVDMIEGTVPRWLEPSMTWEQGEKDLCLVNIPPEHAKTTAITINYTLYRLAMDPNLRVIIVSKSQSMARKMLYAIKSRLTHPKYSDFQFAYGPPGGYQANSEAWNADRIYLSDDIRDSGEKDPSVEALGIGSHVYGARADLVICDDVVDMSNAHRFDEQIDWIQAELMSRISANGTMLIVGTRLAPRDLYSEIRDEKRYPEEDSPWSYLSMPAVLEFADDPHDWKTLWPRSNQPEPGTREALADADGLFPKWDGTRLKKKRARVAPRTWSLVYQQEQVGDMEVFSTEDVRGCVNGSRMAGAMNPGMPGVRAEGMDGLQIVAGLDPATAGYTAAVVIGLDLTTHKRYVLDVKNNQGMKPDELRQMIKDLIAKYKISEFRIEKNSFQSFLTDDREVNDFASRAGCVIKPHYTGTNKYDPDFGVAAMAPMFGNWSEGNNLIELPSLMGSEAVKALVEQLVTWQPGMHKKLKSDAVMALWFAELAAKDRDTRGMYQQHHLKNPFTSPRDKSRQQVIRIDEYLQAQQAGMI